MSNIPTVPGSEQVNTPSQGVRMDASQLMGGARGLMQLSGAVENVGNVAQEFSDRMVHARNAKALLDADLTMRQTTANFRDSLKDLPDEQEWVPKYQEKVQEVQDSIASQPLAPVVRRQLQANMATWAQHTTSEIKQAATQRYIGRIEDQGKAQYNQAIQDQDPVGAEAGIALRESIGTLHKQDAARLRQQIKPRIEAEQINSAITTDPVQTAKILKDTDHWPSISAKTREQYLREATRRANAVQTTNADQMKGLHAQGVALDPDEIKDKVASGEISGASGIYLNAMLTREAKAAAATDKAKIMAEDKATAQQIWEDIQNYDSSTDTNGDVHAEINSRIMELPMSYAGRLQSQLKGQVKKGNVDKTDNGMEVISQFYHEGVFGPLDDDEEKKAARVKSWDAQEALQKYRKEYPKASHKDEREFLQQITGPHVFDKVTAALRGKDQPQFTKGQRVKQGGKVYQFDGQGWSAVSSNANSAELR